MPLSFSNWNASRLGWLGLASFIGFGPSTLRKLEKHTAGDGEKAWRLSQQVLSHLVHKSSTLEDFLTFRKKTDPTLLAQILDKTSILFLLPTDKEFPTQLQNIHDPPGALFLRGCLKALQAPTIAIVGTRSVTSYGRQVTKDIATACAQHGITVISGMALGIDGIAHEATLDAKGRTIAVLGSGLDDSMLYPRQHVALAKRIIETNGAVISESAPLYKAMTFDFPLRNRLISGLAQAVLVVEAAEKSGSLITAHLAAEQGRDVLSVPGPITSRQSMGTNRLLRQGAIPCTSIEDILETLHLETTDTAAPTQTSPSDPEQASLLAAITEPMRADELARKLQRPITDISRNLTQLELQGYIVSPDRRTYARATRRF